MTREVARRLAQEPEVVEVMGGAESVKQVPYFSKTRPLKFAQVFHLMPAGASWFVFNDMFRLNYG